MEKSTSNLPVSVFVSYSHKDDDLREKLRTHLANLYTQGVIDLWDDRRIGPGTEWKGQIDERLEQAELILLLISADFIASDYCREIEGGRAMERHGANEARVVPVKLRPVECDGQPFARLQMLPREAQAVTLWDDIDSAFENVAHGIRETVEEIRGDSRRGERRAGARGSAEQGYLNRLIREVEELARKYSPLTAVAKTHASSGDEREADHPSIALLRHHGRLRGDGLPTETAEHDDALKAFAVIRRAALLGAPGSGKSTTLRKLAHELALRAREDPRAALPVFVTLGEWRGDESLWQDIGSQAAELSARLHEGRNSGGLILLLDGLNEVPTAKRRAKAAQVRALLGEIEARTPVFISCRLEDYRDDLDLGLDTLTLEPLPPPRVRRTLHQWLRDRGREAEVAERLFWQLAGDERLARVFEKWLQAGGDEEGFWSAADIEDSGAVYRETTTAEDDLWRKRVRNPRSLVRLVENPFMLTMLYVVWEREEKLPPNRGELFSEFIDVLLHREALLRESEAGGWRRTDDGERLLSGLRDLAWKMQGDRAASGRPDGDDFGVLTVVSRPVAAQALGGESLLKKAEDATLLEGGEEVRFRHQLLQEYFTAQALQGRLDALRAEELWPPERWWAPSGWEETCILLAGFQCARTVRWLAEAQPWVAARCLLESGAGPEERTELDEWLRDLWLPRLTDLDREPEPEGRAAVGRALGRLGLDNRPGVGLTAEGLPDILWIDIPGGEFLYGDDVERRSVEPFRIARYAVTNRQFEAFLRARDGYHDYRWWRGLDEPRREVEQPSWSEPNHPRETVSWHEAMAFCAWLSHRLGLDIRLPTEWEWERAARGAGGRVYPWGEEYEPGRSNIDEWPHYVARTTTVGIYPRGASAEGVMDLSGNVWEWCLNEYSNPERTQPGGTESRVLRGCSWGGYQDGARADFRDDFYPGGRDGSVGFRVVCSSPIAER